MVPFFWHRRSVSRPGSMLVIAFLLALWLLGYLADLWQRLVSAIDPAYRDIVLITLMPVLIVESTVAMILWGKWRHRGTRRDSEPH